MPFPLIPVIIGVGVTAFAGRKAHDHFSDHPDRQGYCSNCGTNATHRFFESGVNWKNAAGVGLGLGALGLGISSLAVRNIYTCQSCEHHTLSCRNPLCSGFARTGEYYDDELCGQCLEGNDHSTFYKATQDQKELHKCKEVIRGMDEKIASLKAQVSALKKERSSDKQTIKMLLDHIAELERNRDALSRRLA